MAENTNITELKRSEVKDYLVENTQLDLEEVILKLHHEYLLKDTTINLIRIRPNGLDGIRTNDYKLAMTKHKHWNCNWIIITDHSMEMLKTN